MNKFSIESKSVILLSLLVICIVWSRVLFLNLDWDNNTLINNEMISSTLKEMPNQITEEGSDS